jgi:methylphosphotriester-DNA--protein-cysteine methyltransferase
MIAHNDIDDKMLRKLIRGNRYLLGGNKKLKIYGTLRCASGKRMKRGNRVFFLNEAEALGYGYRACQRCKPDTNRKKQVDAGTVTYEI